MANSVHYEIFKRTGAKGGWTLHDVRDSRDIAIAMATELMASEKATGVKVVKETYNDDTGDYLTLKIFEDGHNQVKVAPNADDVPHALPCFKPDDLYSYHARSTIARLLVDFLARNKITVTELIHRADMLEKLEATGTLLQHAVQKVAVAQASSTTTPVQTIVKSLNELTTKSFHRVYRDQRSGMFPNPAASQFATLAAKLAAQSDGGYVLNGAIAQHLKDAKGWDEKVLRLLTLMKEAPPEGPARALLLNSVDAIISEVLNGSAALHELIGAKENLGVSLMSLVQLFLGKEPEADGSEHAGLTLLTHHFAADDLPASRTAIANRITAEFKSVKRLCPDSLDDELKALRRIANRVVMGVGKYLSHEDLVAAFTLRSKRLVTHETLSAHLADSQPDEKLEKMLFVEDNIIGAENKRQLVTFIMPILTAPSFENHFMNPKLPIVQRLHRLAQLQARVRRSGFLDVQRQEISDLLDKIAFEAEARAKLFESIESKSPTSVDKAITILRLCTGATLTEGRLSAKARELVIGHLGRPGFLTGYVAHLAKSDAAAKPTADTAMADLMETLTKAGITPETGLKNIAA